MSLKSLLAKLFPPKIVEVPANYYHLPEPPPEGRELPEGSFGGQVKLGIIVGHTKQNEGARMVEPHGLREYSYNMDVAKSMKNQAPHNMLVEIITRDGRGIVGAYNEARVKLCDCVIELHFNASNGKAQGSSTLCSPDVSDVEFAHIIHKAVSQIFDRQGSLNQGVQTLSKSARGGINVHSFPGGVNCLVEPFYGDNPEDARLGMERRVQYAKALVDAVSLWAKKVDLIK